jgi:RluA family pseudouridine synthase
MSDKPAGPIKLSSPATREFWEMPVLFEDEHLLAVNKPACLLTSPDRYDPNRPNLMRLLHAGIVAGKPWAAERRLDYLANAHRLDFETSGVLLLAKTKPALVALANMFGTTQVTKHYVALVQGQPAEPRFTIEAKLAPHPFKLGLMRVDEKGGKRARTDFQVIETFNRHTLLRCQPLTGRTHQIRAHLRYVHRPIVGDRLYGGHMLLLSTLKLDFRLKAGREERPLISTTALHAERLQFVHPMTPKEIVITAPWPKDLNGAVKYLRRYAQTGGMPASGPAVEEDD